MTLSENVIPRAILSPCMSASGGGLSVEYLVRFWTIRCAGVARTSPPHHHYRRLHCEVGRKKDLCICEVSFRLAIEI